MRKNAKAFISVVCSLCGVVFVKEKRFVKKGQIKFYCCRSHAAKANPGLKQGQDYNRKHPAETYARVAPYAYLGRGKGGKRRDRFSPFRYMMQNANRNSRMRGEACEIDLEYLYALWYKQKGICAYSGVPMTLNPVSYRRDLVPNRASLDRIDSMIGYARGNVQFVCLAVNFAKNSFSHEAIKQFFDTIFGLRGVDKPV